MKHARSDYARIQDPENKIPADEPVFLLRAQDYTAATVVRIWALINEHGGDPLLVALAKQHADCMDAWLVKKTADGIIPEHVVSLRRQLDAIKKTTEYATNLAELAVNDVLAANPALVKAWVKYFTVDLQGFDECPDDVKKRYQDFGESLRKTLP